MVLYTVMWDGLKKEGQIMNCNMNFYCNSLKARVFFFNVNEMKMDYQNIICQLHFSISYGPDVHFRKVVEV